MTLRDLNLWSHAQLRQLVVKAHSEIKFLFDSRLKWTPIILSFCIPLLGGSKALNILIELAEQKLKLVNCFFVVANACLFAGKRSHRDPLFPIDARHIK